MLSITEAQTYMIAGMKTLSRVNDSIGEGFHLLCLILPLKYHYLDEYSRIIGELDKKIKDT
jgi:hypothetical protein